MSEMRAVGFTEFGDASVLKVVTLPVPPPGSGQVRVHVAAATVNPTDIGFRAGFRAGRGLPDGVEPPYIAGMDLAGVIDAALIGPPALAAVKDGGHLIAVRPFQGETERGITISLVVVGQHLHEGARVAELADLAAKGVLTPRVAELIPAEHAADAHRKLEAGGVRGRLVLTF